MRAKQVVLELVSSRVDVVLLIGGRRVDAVRVPVDLPAEPREWMDELGRVAEGVRTAVTRLGAEGLPALVLFQSPTQAVDFSSFPVRGGEALQAAELECMDALPYASDLALVRSALLGRDREGDTRQHHVIAAAEREDVSSAIVAFVERAGLAFGQAVPLNALILAGLVRSMLGTSGPVRGHLHVGEQGSFFLVADGATLLFARQIRIGLESLVTALTRPINRSGGASIQLDGADARRILYEHGRPKRDAVVDETLGLKGYELGPLIQPVLQRLVIEIRQSLRFGMTAERRDELAITLGGPGAAVPGFAELLSSELEVQVHPEPDSGAFDWTTPAAPGGELMEAAGRRPLHGRLNLQPRAVTIERNTRRLRRWLWAGGVLAMVVIGADALRMTVSAADLRKQVDAEALDAAGQDSLALTTTRLMAVVGGLNRLQQNIRREIPGRSNFGAVVREIARATPESIELLTFSIARGGESVAVRVSGFAFGTDGRTELEDYIRTLEVSPLLDTCLLGDVQIGRLDGRYGEQFSASMSIVPTPPPGVAEALAAGGEVAP